MNMYPLWSQNTRVFIDTCSLMEDISETFIWQHLVPTLRQYGIHLIVAKAVVDELNRNAVSTNAAKARRSEKAKDVVTGLIDANEANIFGEERDSFPDNLFLGIFTQLRLKYRLILITQDRKLAKDILSLNHSSAVNRIHGIDVFRIGNLGDPMRWKLDPNSPDGVTYHLASSTDGFASVNSTSPPRSRSKPRTRPKSRTRPKPRTNPFNLSQRTTQLDETQVSVKLIPSQGDTVKDKEGNSLHLGTEIGRGGEGLVYATDSKLVCKIYQRDRLKRLTLDKLELMTSRTIHNPSICWPVSLAYNSRAESVGYLMPKAQGKELQRTVFVKPLLQKTFPHWTRSHLVELTATILDAVAYLHSLNVLIGDINARNILVQDESSVFFVDCDSYQVEGFPCPVGMPPYLAPELYGKKLSSTLRTKEAELFSIATLVFMLLHPGKPPYSHQGGEDPLSNVQKQRFPYPRGDQKNQGIPEGPWRFMFSHLPRYMKDAFHQVFSDAMRLPITEWQELMRRYKSDLKKGHVSDDPFPTEFKQLNQQQVEEAGGHWRSCVACGKDFGAFKDKHTMCRNCFQQHPYSAKKRHTSKKVDTNSSEEWHPSSS